MSHHSSKPNFSQGWGLATFITALAVGAFVLAGYIKKTTFQSPNDPMAATATAEPAAH